MASDTKPTVLFVHGNWHSPAHFAPICDLFNKAGYPTSCPRLASCDANPSVGPYEDAASLLPELVKLVEAQERDVIVVAHSYGGVVATQAVTKQYAKNVRGMQGKRGGILRIVYLCALLPVEGETVMSQFGVGPSDPIPPHILLDGNDMATLSNPGERFYADLSPQEQQHWIEQLIPNAVKVMVTPVSHLEYSHYPITYIFCEDDQAIPFGVQKQMVEKVKNLGIEVQEYTLKSSHSPFLSMPGKLVEIIKGL